MYGFSLFHANHLVIFFIILYHKNLMRRCRIENAGTVAAATKLDTRDSPPRWSAAVKRACPHTPGSRNLRMALPTMPKITRLSFRVRRNSPYNKRMNHAISDTKNQIFFIFGGSAKNEVSFLRVLTKLEQRGKGTFAPVSSVSCTSPPCTYWRGSGSR